MQRSANTVDLQWRRWIERVLCAAEDIAIVRRTVMAAYDAELPAGCQRTIYLCDDGKDPKKRKFCEGLGPEVLPSPMVLRAQALDPTTRALCPAANPGWGPLQP